MEDAIPGKAWRPFSGVTRDWLRPRSIKEKRSSPTLRVLNNSADSGFASLCCKGSYSPEITKYLHFFFHQTHFSCPRCSVEQEKASFLSVGSNSLAFIPDFSLFLSVGQGFPTFVPESAVILSDYAKKSCF